MEGQRFLSCVEGSPKTTTYLSYKVLVFYNSEICKADADVQQKRRKGTLL